MIELILVILFSLAFGSFANNLISFFISSNRFDIEFSTCFCGKRELKIIELIPIFSFIFQKAKCVKCFEKISIRYPLVEILTLLIGICLFFYFGFSVNTIILFFIIYILLIISVIDYSKLIIPNVLIIVLFSLVFVFLILNSEHIINQVYKSLVIPLCLIVIRHLFKIFNNKEVIGFGDIKLIFVLSLLLDITLVFTALWFSSLIALISISLFNIKKLNKIRDIKIPFGLFISIGFSIIYLINRQFDINIIINKILWSMK